MLIINQKYAVTFLLVLCTAGAAIGEDMKSPKDELTSICGSTLRSMPEVIKLREKEFNARANESDQSSEADDTPRRETAFYDPATNAIVMKAWQQSDNTLAYTANELNFYDNMVLFHELVHAWQYQEFDADFQRLSSHEDILHALREGHAEYCTRLYCERAGMEKYHQRRQNGLLRRTIGQNAVSETDYFKYVECMRFFSFLAEQDPPLSFADVLRGRLPSEYEIVFPHAYVDGSRATSTKVVTWLDVLNTSLESAGTEDVNVTEIGFRAFRLKLREICPTVSFCANLEEAFVAGTRFSGNGVTVECIQFDTSEKAKAYFEYIHRKYEHVTQTTVEIQQTIEDELVRYFATTKIFHSDGTPESSLLLYDDCTVSTVSCPSPDGAAVAPQLLISLPEAYARAKN